MHCVGGDTELVRLGSAKACGTDNGNIRNVWASGTYWVNIVIAWGSGTEWLKGQCLGMRL